MSNVIPFNAGCTPEQIRAALALLNTEALFQGLADLSIKPKKRRVAEVIAPAPASVPDRNDLRQDKQ